MPEYLSPGVYVEEVSTGPRPIEGVSTSTAGFAGFTERGPLAPRLVTSWQDYVCWYGSYLEDIPDLADETPDPYMPYGVRGFFDNGGQRLFVARVIGKNAAVASRALPGQNGEATVTAIGPGDWGNRILVKVSPASLRKPNTMRAAWFQLTLLYYRAFPEPFVDPTDPANAANPSKSIPDVLEVFDNLSLRAADASFAETVVNGQSRLVRLANVQGPLDDTADLETSRLDNGTYEAPELKDYTDPDTAEIDERRGLAGLAAIDEVALLAAPADETKVEGLTQALIDQCEALKDRFAVLNGPQNNGDVGNIDPLVDSTYGAIYYPWVRVRAPHTAEGDIVVPPCGHVVGIYARVDVERGVHKAPANEVVRGIVVRDLPGNKKPLRFTIDKRQHDILNPRGVNVIRDFRSDRRGIRVWGARTTSSDAMWKYVSVRRLFIFVEESIDEGTQWVVFEPNYEPTWQAVRLSISGFLRSVWRSGGLAGTTPDEAFFVKCDRTTMTQDDIDNGRLICLVGIAPVKPAEFVIFRISQKTLELEA
jgi:phage tail sheath protein FI